MGFTPVRANGKGAAVTTEQEEMIDVITPTGMWTGETLPKSTVHAQGLWHACVHGVITNGREQVICQFRGPDVRPMGNVWDAVSVAGHISALTPQERARPEEWDLVQQAWRALRREFMEELGVELRPDGLLNDSCVMFGITRTNQPTEDGWLDRTLNVNFMLLMPDLDPRTLLLERGKVLKAEWRDADLIEENVLEGHALYAVRQPDNIHLLQGIVDCARRMRTVQRRAKGLF